jgi:hypothetical protein
MYLGDLEITPYFTFNVSPPLTIALTPGNLEALDVSIFRIFAWGRGLRRIMPQSIPGSLRSSV